jgi:hypothetical protein
MASAARAVWCRAALRAMLVSVSELRPEIFRAYERENCHHPFIGEAFESAESGRLRVMTSRARRHPGGVSAARSVTALDRSPMT